MHLGIRIETHSHCKPIQESHCTGSW